MHNGPGKHRTTLTGEGCGDETTAAMSP
jgi:hypothetical protein